MYVKNKIAKFLLLMVCMMFTNNIQNSDMKNYVDQLNLLKNRLACQQKEQDAAETLAEICESVELLYKKIVEGIAIYYCGSNMYGMQYAYEHMVVDVSYDILKLVKLIIIYLPKLYNSKNISRFEKIKQSILIASFITVVVICIKKYKSNEHSTDKYNQRYEDFKTYSFHQKFVDYNPRPGFRN